MTALALCLLLAVVDGDTIICQTDRGMERVRIYGLDCPEKRAPGGPEAARAMIRLLDGKTVELKRRGRDRYGRTVAKVFAGGRDVTTQMISLGVCAEYCRYSKGEYGTCR